ncbi:MAG: septum formation initiator, partial [Bdellovibrionales bacterium]|nr:septum formation initiator [Oligoflexia bacterium]
RSVKVSLAYHDQMCERLFGITKPVDTAATNRTFYDQLFNSSVRNIFFTNGSNDPWSNLSLTDQSPSAGANPALKLLTIAGAAHCDDLGVRSSAALTQARTQFNVLVGQWLSE